jgi:hypothetical protein
VSLTAANVAAGLLRPERSDVVHLMVTVPGDAQRGEGAALLERFARAFKDLPPSCVHTHVLVRSLLGIGGPRRSFCRPFFLSFLPSFFLSFFRCLASARSCPRPSTTSP